MCKAVMELKQEGQREGEDIKAIELIQNAMIILPRALRKSAICLALRQRI